MRNDHTLDDVACLILLPIKRRLLDHSTITRVKACEIRIMYLGVDLTKASEKVDDTRGSHAIFSSLVKLYGDNLDLAEDANREICRLTIIDSVI